MWKNQDNFPQVRVFTETQKSFPCFPFSLFNLRELSTVSLTLSTSWKPPVNVTKCNIPAARLTLGCCPEILSPGSSRRGKGAASQCASWRATFCRAGGCNTDRDTRVPSGTQTWEKTRSVETRREVVMPFRGNRRDFSFPLPPWCALFGREHGGKNGSQQPWTKGACCPCCLLLLRYFSALTSFFQVYQQ